MVSAIDVHTRRRRWKKDKSTTKYRFITNKQWQHLHVWLVTKNQWLDIHALCMTYNQQPMSTSSCIT